MRKISLLTFLMVVILGALGYAQTQPTTAENRQDEVVAIDAPPASNDGVLSILRSNSKSDINNYISEVVELQNAVAFELLPHVLKAVTLEKGTARVLKYAPPDGGKARYFIQVITTRDQMPSIVKSIKDLDLKDVKSSSGAVKNAIRMKYRKASDVGTILKNTTLTGEGIYYADDVSNTLFFEDSVSDTETNLTYINLFDVPSPQVNFDVQIVEISKINEGKLGLDLEAWKRGLGGQTDITGNVFEGGDVYSRLDYLMTIDATAAADFLNYATQQGSAKTVKRAKVSANNLTAATVSVTKRIPYFVYNKTTGTASMLTEANNEADSSKEVDVTDPEYPLSDPRVVTITPQYHFDKVDLGKDSEGISLSILPVIGTEMVTAQVGITANTITGYDQLDRPVISTQNFNTNVTLQNNQMLHVGTIENDVQVKYRRGIPGLKDIPVLKYLFSVEGSRSEQTKAYVIVTPTYSESYTYGIKKNDEEGDVLKLTEGIGISEDIKSETLPVK